MSTASGIFIFYTVFIAWYMFHICQIVETKLFRENIACGFWCSFIF